MSIPPPEPPDGDYAPAPTTQDPRHQLELRLIAEAKYAEDFAEVFDRCSPDDFARGSHRIVWQAMRDVHSDGGEVNLLTVHDRIEEGGKLHDIGGAAGLDHIMAWDGYTGSAAHYADKLHAIATRERIAEAGRRIAASAARGEDIDLAAVAAELASHAPKLDRGVEKPWDVIEAITDYHVNREAHKGVALGWSAIDQLYRVESGLLSIVTGVPGSGKSSWVDASLIRLAQNHGWKFAMFSPESAPTERHTLQLCSVYSGRPWEAQTMGELHPAIEWVNGHFTWIKSTASVSLDEVMRRAEAIRRREDIQGLVIDPWNELADQRPSDVTETQHISHSLTKIRRWGREHGVHIWIIAHPTKQVKRVDGTLPVPTLYDIAGSATWNDKADMGVVVHRDKLKPGPVQIQVVKVRFRHNGTLGVGRLHFDVPSGRYSDLAPEWRGSDDHF